MTNKSSSAKITYLPDFLAGFAWTAWVSAILSPKEKNKIIQEINKYQLKKNYHCSNYLSSWTVI